MRIGKDEKTTYPGTPVGRIVEECVVLVVCVVVARVVAACALAMKESRKADMSFIATMTTSCRSSSWRVS